MRRQVRRILLAAFLALHGTVALSGPALHSILGLEHAKGGLAADREGTDRPVSQNDDCPVCHFLSQGQLAGGLSHVLSPDAVCIESGDDAPLCFPPAIDRPSRPRGPPAA